MKLKTTALISILLGITYTCLGSEAGGEYRTIEDVIKREKIVAIATARVNGFRKTKVHDVTMSKEETNKKSQGDETVYHSRTFKTLTLDMNVVDVISGKLDQKRLQSLTYTEPFFSHTFRLLLDGTQEDVLCL